MDFSDRIGFIITANADDAVREFRKLGATATTEVAAAEGASGKMSAAWAQSSMLVKAGLAAAGLAIAKFSFDAVKASTDWANSVRIVEQATGMTAQQSSKLTAIMDDYQINVDSGAKAFARLGRSVFENQDALSKFGVEVVKTNDGNTNMRATLGNIADAYSNLQDPAAKAALVNEAFGKTGRDLIPILEQGRNGIQQMYDAVPDKQILDQQQLNNAREFQLAMDNLNDVVLELKLTIGNALIPVLTDSANTMAQLSRASIALGEKMPWLSGHVGEVVKAFGMFAMPGVGSGFMFKDMISQITGAVDDSGYSFDEQGRMVFKSKQAMDDYIASTDQSSFSTADLTVKTDALTQALRDYQDQINGIISADLGVESSKIRVAEATAKAAEAAADGNATELERQKTLIDAETAIQSYVVSLGKQAVANGDATGNIQGQIDALNFLKGTLAPDSPLRTFLDNYIGQLESIPGYKSTTVELTSVLSGVNINGLTQTPPPFPGGFDGDPSTPYPMAAGGIVTRPTNALIGEAGPEAVIPLSRFGASGAGTTINLVLDGEVISRVVRQDLISIGRANGSSLGQFA